MGVSGKFEVEIEIKSSGDSFFELFTTKPDQICKYAPDNIQGCQLIKGEFGLPSCVSKWNYTIGGNKLDVEELVEAVDLANKIVRYRIIGGDLLQLYKSFTLTLQVTSYEGGISGVKWISEFVKMTDDSPYPITLVDFCTDVTKNIDNYHLKA